MSVEATRKKIVKMRKILLNQKTQVIDPEAQLQFEQD
jgi:hypothetical protein